MLPRRLFLPLAAASLAGCSPVDVLNATVARTGTVDRGIAYGPLARQRLDVYRPTTPGPWPVVVFIYGGSWKSGARADYAFVAERLVRIGCLAIVPDYRLFPEVRFPTFVEDASAALAWAQSHATALGGDPRRVFVMGHSAGAHIAAMAALNPAYLTDAGGAPNRLAGLIGLAGPYDFLPITDPDVIPVFAGTDPPATQPITFVRPGAPPAFLATGLDDTTVNPQNTRSLTAALRAVGAAVTEREYSGVGHVGLITALTALFDARAPVSADIAAFIAATPSR